MKRRLVAPKQRVSEQEFKTRLKMLRLFVDLIDLHMREHGENWRGVKNITRGFLDDVEKVGAREDLTDEAFAAAVERGEHGKKVSRAKATTGNGNCQGANRGATLPRVRGS